MIDLIKRILGIQSPSRSGMTQKEWRKLDEELHIIGIDLAKGKDFTSPPSNIF